MNAIQVAKWLMYMSLSIICLTTCSTLKQNAITECLENTGGSPSEVTIQRCMPPQLQEMLPYFSANIRGSGQVVLVSNNDSKSQFAKIYLLDETCEGWRLAFAPMDAVIGRNGFADLGEKREGDKKAPTGIYRLKRTFGYAQSIETKMPYKQVTDDDVWVDDPSAKDYNRLVKKNETDAASVELMKRDDNRYRYGVVVEYNTNRVIKSYGSAIFIHVWAGSHIPTVGCIAASEAHVLRIIRWLDPSKKPVVIMGTEKKLKALIIPPPPGKGTTNGSSPLSPEAPPV